MTQISKIKPYVMGCSGKVKRIVSNPLYMHLVRETPDLQVRNAKGVRMAITPAMRAEAGSLATAEGLVQTQRKNFSAAFDLFKKAVSLNPTSLAWISMADAYHRIEGDNQTAEKEAVARSYYYHGCEYLEAGDTASAIDALAYSLEQNPDAFDVLLQYGRASQLEGLKIYKTMGNSEPFDLTTVTKKFTERQPTDAEEQAFLAIFNAVTSFRRVCEGEAPAKLKAQAYHYMTDFYNTIKLKLYFYEQAIDFDPEDSRAWLMKARLILGSEELRDIKEAEKYLDRVIEINDNDLLVVVALIQKGGIYLTSDTERAIAFFDEALEFIKLMQKSKKHNSISHELKIYKADALYAKGCLYQINPRDISQKVVVDSLLELLELKDTRYLGSAAVYLFNMAKAIAENSPSKAIELLDTISANDAVDQQNRAAAVNFKGIMLLTSYDINNAISSFEYAVALDSSSPALISSLVIAYSLLMEKESNKSQREVLAEKIIDDCSKILEFPSIESMIPPEVLFGTRMHKGNAHLVLAERNEIEIDPKEVAKAKSEFEVIARSGEDFSHVGKKALSLIKQLYEPNDADCIDQSPDFCMPSTWGTLPS